MAYEQVQKPSSSFVPVQKKVSEFAPSASRVQAKDVTAGEQEQMPKVSTPATDANWLMKHPLFKGNQFLQRVVAPASESESLESEEETLQRQEEGNESATPYSLPVQAKLTIGEPGDKYEQEADRVASQVVKQINSPEAAQSTQGQSVQRQEEPVEELQRQPSISDLQRSPLPLEVQREAMPAEEELQAKSILQRREAIAGGEATNDLDTAINSARGGGQPLDAGLQRSMGQAMGADFSGVKVHTDAQSDELNQSIQAKAFTTGQDVFFRQGEYNPGSRGGQELIAHELTHVVQQSIQAKSKKANSVGIVQRVPIIQRVLVDNAGNPMSLQEINQLIAQYPERTNDIQEAANNRNSFTANTPRSGLRINPYAPPSRTGFHYSLPEGFTTTSSSNKTNRQAANSLGMGMNLSRTDFGKHFTEDILSSKYGSQYAGSEKIASGMKLSEAGLDRTHHLSDSSIRIIVEWLNNHPQRWHNYGVNWVRNWMNALTGGQGVEELMNLMGVGHDTRPPTTSELNTVVDHLSNNTHQVGFGDSHTNQKVVGPFFDSSKTPSGFDSPLAASISMATEGLKNIGLPQEIIQAALAEVVDKKTGKKQSSMTFFLPPREEHPFGKGPFGGGGGFGGGGLGGGSTGMVF